MKKHNWGAGAFTLIELMVVVAIIGILAAVLIPAIGKAMDQGRLTRATANARTIYTAIMGAVLQPTDGISFPEKGDLADGRFPSSTDYFRYLIVNEILNTDYTVFAEEGIKPYKGMTADEFKAEHNAWCVVSGVGSCANDKTPFIFSRNLDVSHITPLGNLTERLAADAIPFGNKALVVIFKGGAGLGLRGTALSWESFNPTGASNEVMRTADDI